MTILSFDVAATAPPRADSIFSINVLGRTLVEGRPVRCIKPIEFIVALALAGGRMSRDAVLGRIYEYEACQSAVPTLSYRARKMGVQVDFDSMSQCYTLRTPVRVDALEVIKLARRKQARQALWLYGGPCLASSTSPLASALRLTVENEIVRAVLDSRDVELMSRASRYIDHSELAQHCTEVDSEPLAKVLGRSYLSAINC